MAAPPTTPAMTRPGHGGPTRPRPSPSTLSRWSCAATWATARAGRRRAWPRSSTGLRARGLTATAIDLPKPQGRGRPAGLPPRRAHGAGRGRRRSLVRRPGGEPGRRRTRRAVRRPRPVQLPAPSARARRSGRKPGSPTGRRSAARSCCCRASRTRSPGSSCCGPPCGLLAHAELVTYPRLGHTLKPVLPDVLDRTAAFLRAIAADVGQRAAATHLDLDAEVLGQGGHAHRRPGRRLGREVLAVDRVHRREIGEVAQVDRALHDVGEVEARRPRAAGRRCRAWRASRPRCRPGPRRGCPARRRPGRRGRRSRWPRRPWRTGSRPARGRGGSGRSWAWLVLLVRVRSAA